MTSRQSWQKMKRQHVAAVEKLLRLNERWYMNACMRYLKNLKSKDSTIWILDDRDCLPAAIIIQYRQSLLPVLCGKKNIPVPDFLCSPFGIVSVHSLQGCTNDVLVIETALEKTGLYAREKRNYDIMCIEPGSNIALAADVPSGLVIRKPQRKDIDELAALHAAYELEEVLPAASEFNPSFSRLNFERIFLNEQMLVAELGGRLIGKINTNAVTFTRFQVGGVYVHPDCRGLGIAGRMAAAFVKSLLAQGRGISLFVNKTNLAARKVYLKIGFEISGDYSISYY
jgi:ribosomal protein S18 acetylase RimI-like enzyme